MAKLDLRARYRQIIQEFCLMDDIFMVKIFENNVTCTELILRIILENDKLKVLDVRTQYDLKNLLGRSARLDILAQDEDGSYYNIEVQRADKGAVPRRARYNSSLLDAGVSKAGAAYEDLPDTYIIFITEHDVLASGLPIYHVERNIRETGNRFNDGSHIVYVNGAIKNNTALGKLMQDFACKNPQEMHYQELAERAAIFKNDDKEAGVMCKLMEDFAKEVAELVRLEVAEEARQARLEGERENSLNIALLMLADNEAMEKISRYTGLSEAEISELASRRGAQEK